MKKIGLIGCGRIGGPVAKALQQGLAGNWTLASVLTQHQASIGNLTTLVDADAFFGQEFKLIIDTAGPGSLALYGERALRICDIWSVNSAALTDTDLFQLLEQVAIENGHRLRLLSGAIAGLDGISTLSEDKNVSVRIVVDLAPGSEPEKTVFRGGLKEAAEKFPTSVNVAVATGLAAGELNRVEVEVRQPGPGQERKLGLKAESRFGSLDIECRPNIIPDQGINMVSANIIAALRREDQAIWAG